MQFGVVDYWNMLHNVLDRNLKDGIDCGSEADLYGLVSTILEEVDPMDSYFSQELVYMSMSFRRSPVNVYLSVFIKWYLLP